MALGAQRIDLVRMMVLPGTWPALAGVIIGLAIAIPATKYTSSQIQLRIPQTQLQPLPYVYGRGSACSLVQSHTIRERLLQNTLANL
jgi:hypothetical protein